MKLSDIKNVTNYIIDNNKRLVEEGKKPTAVCLEGEAGIGKTSIIEQIASERGMTFVKLNMAQCEEVGDLLGLPVKQVLIDEIDESGNKTSKWVNESSLKIYFQKPCGTYEITNQTRTTYAPPAWLPREANPNGILLCLDDYSRCNSMLMQATMELIDRQTFIGWDLPKNTQIILSTNPDDGSYSVTALDSAQISRMCKFVSEFDINDWALWAEGYGIDDRCINFALSYADELFKVENNKNCGINARSYTTFCNIIGGLKKWDSTEARDIIYYSTTGCFNDKDGIIGTLFNQFINNQLDKLVPAEEMLTGKWETVAKKMHESIYKDGKHRAHIAAILTTRLTNKCLTYFDTKGSKDAVVCDRLLDLVNYDGEDKLISEDLVFNILKTVIGRFPGRTKKLLLNPKVRTKILF